MGAVSCQPSAVSLGWRGAVYGLASGVALPAAALWAAVNPRTRAHWLERLGWTLPAVEPGALWLHAASLGEGQAAAAVAAGLSVHAPELPLLRTATSETGRAQVLPVDELRCLPLDAPWLQRRFVRRVRPRALVLVEGELWPGLLMACAGRVPVAVLGLRVGEGTRRLASRFPGLWRAMMATVGHWSARDGDDVTWLAEQLGREVPVIGDLKLEAPIEPAVLRFPQPPILAGSTRAGDEAALLEAWRSLDARPQLVLAPRHASRFDEVATLIEDTGLRWGRRSALEGPEVPAGIEILLLDSVGELAGLYPLARVAFIGGTFDSAIGGHSAAEAARAGVPVVHGPENHANAGSFDTASCFAAAGPSQLPQALAAALEAARPEPARGEAVDRALDFLAPLLASPLPPEAPHRPWARPLVPVYRALSARRARRPRQAAPCPVISVGNIASGGTGKTPVVRHLWALLAARGVKAAVVSRGYRRSARGPFLRHSDGEPASGAGLGDELAMLAGDGALVVSCPDRLLAVRKAAELGAEVCLLDDGFQQRDVAVDLQVVTVDARHPTAGGLLPAGELREAPSALARADLLWVNHGILEPGFESLAGDASRVSAVLTPVGWLHRGQELPLAAGPTGRVAVLAGIARPEGLLRQLRHMGLVPTQRLLYRDHPSWSDADLAAFRALAESTPLVSTEKDLARLPEDLPCWALRVRLEVQQGEQALATMLSEFLVNHGIGEAP
jgi:3-deoxy-D-manno-octulosonic-acid transferase